MCQKQELWVFFYDKAFGDPGGLEVCGARAHLGDVLEEEAGVVLLARTKWQASPAKSVEQLYAVSPEFERMCSVESLI